MLYGVLDVCDLNCATAVFPGRLDRALLRLGVGWLRHRRQQIGHASSSVLASASVLIMSNYMCIVFPVSLNPIIYGNVDDRTCDQGRSGTFDQEVAAGSIYSRSRRFRKSFRPDF